jgi:penicillin-binding protein-related factor A (putative recombinase)
MKKTTEKTIEGEILDWINRSPHGFAFKINTVGIYDEKIKSFRTPSKFTLKGTADILGIWAGKPLAIEVKKVGGRISDEQKAFVKKYRERGGIAFFAFNLEDVQKHLNYFDMNGACNV